VNLHLVQGTPVKYGSVQESLAIAAWRKQQRIDLLRTIALATAVVNPEKAASALNRLIEESFPEVAKDRERAVDRAMEIMEKEKDRAYAVAPVGGGSLKGNSWERAQNILRNRRRPSRGH
jgi:hypothetical protein